MYNPQYFCNQNCNMPMNMMNQNNMNNFYPNNIPMNMMNQYNNCMPNQNNMNMMMDNNNYNKLFVYSNNMMNCLNNYNMYMNNNMGNPGFNNMFNNNMQNLSGNENNKGFNNNNSQILMKNIFDNLKFEEKPYKMQKAIAFCLDNNNNKSNENCVLGGNGLFTTSSNDENIQINDNNSKDIINIVFVTMKGNRHNRKCNQNDTIKNVLENFLEGFGLPKTALKEIIFLNNAINLNNLEDNITLKQFRILNNSKINIVDMKNIIGAYN